MCNSSSQFLNMSVTSPSSLENSSSSEVKRIIEEVLELSHDRNCKAFKEVVLSAVNRIVREQFDKQAAKSAEMTSHLERKMDQLENKVMQEMYVLSDNTKSAYRSAKTATPVSASFTFNEFKEVVTAKLTNEFLSDRLAKCSPTLAAVQ